eukprot:m.230938 g.230938  ORF g.230938 m.230938 type:complete len:66 (+) comp33590_c3_seq1:3345-3542(+)
MKRGISLAIMKVNIDCGVAKQLCDLFPITTLSCSKQLKIGVAHFGWHSERNASCDTSDVTLSKSR